MPKTPRPSAQLPTVSRLSQCGECDESPLPETSANAHNEPSMETVDPDTSPAAPGGGAEGDRTNERTPRWTD